MQKPIVRDEEFLAQKSAPATFMDVAVAQDLLDTLVAHAEHCVGLAGYKSALLRSMSGRLISLCLIRRLSSAPENT